MKASEFETLDKTVEVARRVELSFQTSPTASKPNQSLDEWKVTPPNAFVSSTSVKSQYQHSQRQQRACYTCGETTHLSRYCPKYRKDTPKQPEICRNYYRFPNALPAYLSAELEQLQKRAMRIIFPFTSYRDALQQARLETLSARRELITSKLFESISSNENHRLYKLLPSRNKCHFNMRHKRNFNIPMAKTKRLMNTFIYSNCN